MKYPGAVASLLLATALTACGAPDGEGSDDSSANPSAAEAAPKTGKIAGSLSYPSDYIPEDMQVCAEDTASKEVTCKGGFGGDSYEMELPFGTYEVYARTDDYGGGYRAYYNVAVICGLKIVCRDRDPIKVEVKGGNTVSGIDPVDWYAPQ
jgi:hypothetical protein